jgi:ABC-type sugar transport system permease subunit
VIGKLSSAPPATGRISARDDMVALGFLAPFLAVFAVFIGYPVFYSLWISLHRVTIYSDFYDLFGTMEWVGLDNYGRILGDPVFWWSVLLTFVYAGLTISGGLALALALALLLKRRRRGFGLLRAGFFLPNVFDIFVVSVIWLLLYNPNGGLVSSLLAAAGLGKAAAAGVLNNPWLTLPAIAVAMVLKNAGFGMILFLTSLHNISPSIFEAAEIDGASPRQTLLHVTLPLLRPIILFLVVTGLVGSLNAFAEIFGMTEATGGSSVLIAGQTLQSARISAFHLFMLFNESSYGEAAAVSFVLLVIALIVSGINFKLLAPKH